MYKIVRAVIVLLFTLNCLPASARWSSNGRITNADPIIKFNLSIAKGSQVSIGMTRISGDLQPYMVLEGSPDGRIFRSDVGGANERQAQLSLEAGSSGTYTLTVTRVDDKDGKTTGDFILTMDGATIAGEARNSARILPALKTPAIVLNAGERLTGEINDNTYITNYLVFLNKGQTINVVMQRQDGSLQPMMAFQDTQDNILAHSTNGSGLAVLQTKVETAGWYLVTATREDVETGKTQGTYEIFLSDKN